MGLSIPGKGLEDIQEGNIKEGNIFAKSRDFCYPGFNSLVSYQVKTYYTPINVTARLFSRL